MCISVGTSVVKSNSFNLSVSQGEACSLQTISMPSPLSATFLSMPRQLGILVITTDTSKIPLCCQHELPQTNLSTDHVTFIIKHSLTLNATYLAAPLLYVPPIVRNRIKCRHLVTTRSLTSSTHPLPTTPVFFTNRGVHPHVSISPFLSCTHFPILTS